MAVPNESAFVESFIGPRLRLMPSEDAPTEDQTRANSFAAVNAGCVEIRKKDRRWGLLIKTGGAKVMNRAADIWLYDLGDGTAQVVDVVSNAEGFGGDPPGTAWQEKDIRSIGEWATPYTEAPVPEPVPPVSGGGDAALEQRVAVLEAQVAELTVRVSALESTSGGESLHGKTICLKSKANGKWLRADVEHPPAPVNANGEDSQSFEEYEVLVR